MTLTLPLAELGSTLTGAAAIGAILISCIGVARSWRKGPADALLTEAQARNENDAGWIAKLAVVQAEVAAAKADARAAWERTDQIQGQIDALRTAKDTMELDLRRVAREAEDRADRAEATLEDCERRVMRLETQVRAAGLLPVD